MGPRYCGCTVDMKIWLNSITAELKMTEYFFRYYMTLTFLKFIPAGNIAWDTRGAYQISQLCQSTP